MNRKQLRSIVLEVTEKYTEKYTDINTKITEVNNMTRVQLRKLIKEIIEAQAPSDTFEPGAGFNGNIAGSDSDIEIDKKDLLIGINKIRIESLKINNKLKNFVDDIENDNFNTKHGLSYKDVYYGLSDLVNDIDAMYELNNNTIELTANLHD